MARKRPKLYLVADGRRRSGRRAAAGLVPGLVAGVAALAAARYLSAARGRRNNLPTPGVLTAEVHSNGHSKVKLGSLDSFS
jgi:hypothetical protein